MKHMVLCLFMVMIAPAILFSQTATAPSAGDGSSANPYQIASLENLYWIAQSPGTWGSCFMQTANIDASATSGWDGGAGWPLISYFSGTYDGNGHTISNLTIDRSGNISVGLFGYVYAGATIRRLGVVGVRVAGNYDTGGLVGSNRGTVEYCFATGTVRSTVNYIGGLVGSNAGSGVIRTSFSHASAFGNDCVGSLAGENHNGGQILNSYATGTANGGDAGGLVGSSYLGTVTNSYSTGIASGHGLIGFGGGTCTNSFWDMTTSGSTSSGGGTGKTTAEMMTRSTFTNAGWDTTTIWTLAPGSYPHLTAVRDSGVAEPTVQASSLRRTGGTVHGVTLNWKKGNGEKRIVLAATGSSIVDVPYDWCGFTAGSVYSSGDKIGGSSVVYCGTDTTATITGLLMNTSYAFAVFEYNGSSGYENYLADTPATTTVSTDTLIPMECKAGTALRFDGADDCVDFGDTVGNFGISDFTMEAWIKAEAKGALFCKRIDPSHGSFIIWSMAEDSVLSIEMDNDVSGENYLAVPAACRLVDTTWHFVALTRSGVRVRMYADGVKCLDTASTSTITIGNAACATIGRRYIPGVVSDQHMKGTIDEFRIWNVARSDSEIAVDMDTIYAAVPLGLTEYWQFNEGEGPVAYDAVPGSPSSLNSFDYTATSGWVTSTIPVPHSSGVSVQNNGTEIPKAFSLKQNYPNPFNPSTVISYFVGTRCFVSVQVFDVLGRNVATLVDGTQNAGPHQVVWNAAGYPSGVYFYRLQAGGQAGTFAETKKLLLLK